MNSKIIPHNTKVDVHLIPIAVHSSYISNYIFRENPREKVSKGPKKEIEGECEEIDVKPTFTQTSLI